MAAAYDSGSQAAASVTSSPISWTHTPVGTCTVVIVGVSYRESDGSSTRVTTATYGGVGLTRLGGTSVDVHSAIELWALDSSSIPTGAQTVSIAFTTTSLSRLVAGVIAFTGASLTGSTVTTAGAASGVPTITATSGGTLSATVMAQNTSTNPTATGSGQTRRYVLSGGSGASAVSGAGSTSGVGATHTYGGASGSPYAIAAINIFDKTAITQTVNQATETDAARPISWAPKKRLVNKVTETDLARPITRGGVIVSVGQAQETDTSRAITTPIRRLVGQAEETELATPIVRDIVPSPRVTAKWQYFLAESSDLTKIAEITNHTKDAQFELTINQPGAFQFRIPTNTDWNDFIVPVKHCVIAQRNKSVVWSGPIWTKDEIFEAQSINITCVGWLEILFHRFYTGEGNVVSTSVNAGTIIFDMLALANADHDTWITEGANTNTQTRTVTLEPFQNFGEQIKALTEVENGCDIEVDPETRELNIFAAEDYKVSPAVFDFNVTRSNLQSFKRSTDAAQMANDWYVRGTVGAAQATDDNSISYTGQLLQQVISVSETADISLLGAIANAELAVNSLPRVLHNFLPVSDPNKSPQFFEDWNIRDQIAVRAIRDGLVVEGVGPDFPYGDFEDVANGTIGWQTYNSPVGISRTITQSHTGSASAQVQTASTTANGIISNRSIASVNPSARYEYTIWVKSPTSYNYVVGVWLYEGNEISTLVPGAATFTNAAVAGTNAWQENTLTFDTTRYTAYANIGVYCSTGQTATSFYIDDISLVLVGDSVAQKTRVFGAQISIDENGNQSVTNIQNTWQGGG